MQKLKHNAAAEAASAAASVASRQANARAAAAREKAILQQVRTGSRAFSKCAQPGSGHTSNCCGHDHILCITSKCRVEHAACCIDS